MSTIIHDAMNVYLDNISFLNERYKKNVPTNPNDSIMVDITNGYKDTYKKVIAMGSDYNVLEKELVSPDSYLALSNGYTGETGVGILVVNSFSQFDESTIGVAKESCLYAPADGHIMSTAVTTLAYAPHCDIHIDSLDTLMSDGPSTGLLPGAVGSPWALKDLTKHDLIADSIQVVLLTTSLPFTNAPLPPKNDAQIQQMYDFLAYVDKYLPNAVIVVPMSNYNGYPHLRPTDLSEKFTFKDEFDDEYIKWAFQYVDGVGAGISKYVSEKNAQMLNRILFVQIVSDTYEADWVPLVPDFTTVPGYAYGPHTITARDFNLLDGQSTGNQYAAAKIAATCALYKSANYTFPPKQVKGDILKTASKSSPPDFSKDNGAIYGVGYLDLKNLFKIS